MPQKSRAPGICPDDERGPGGLRVPIGDEGSKGKNGHLKFGEGLGPQISHLAANVISCLPC